MDESEIKSIVTGAYRSVLNRDPDPGGLKNYSMMIAQGASKEKLEFILRNSDEYRNRSKSKSASIFEPSTVAPQPAPVPPTPPPSSPDTAAEEHFKSIVASAYRSVLGRDPDTDGLNNYTKQLRTGLTEQGLITTLKNSDEYMMKNMTQSLPGGGPESVSSIAYCMMGTDRLHEIRDYVPAVLPYVDHFIFIDGESSDGTVEYLNSLKNSKIEAYVHPWNDQFSGQRNNYVQKLRDRDFQGWMLTSDTDEHFPEETLIKLRTVIAQAEQSGINNIMFNAVDIFLDDNDRTKEVSRYISNYWKSLLFKFNPGLHYEGEPHESVMGVSGQGFRTDLKYEHARSHRKIMERAVENFFVSNSNRFSEKWIEFRFACTQAGFEKFKDFFKRFREGTLPADVENWIWDHRNDNYNEGDSEVREMAQLYFDTLHLEKKGGGDR